VPIYKIKLTSAEKLYDGESFTLELTTDAAKNDYLSDNIFITGREFNPDNFKIVMHEIGHGTYERLSEGASNALIDFFNRFIDNDKITGSKVNTETDTISKQLREYIEGNISIEETIVDLFSTLLTLSPPSK